jgi:hypothetical protein
MTDARISYATQLFLDEIAYPGTTRDDAAQRYGWALQRDDINWPVVNEAIIARWSKSALSYIKRKAWA